MMSRRYAVEWTTEAWSELEAVPAFGQRAIQRAVGELAFEAEVETRNRKRLRAPLDILPDASGEIRVVGKFRIFYAVSSESRAGNESKTVEILRVIIKDTDTTARALGSKR